jgi:hypothetical protein
VGFYLVKVQHVKGVEGGCKGNASKDESLDLLRKNAAAAATTIRNLSDAELDRALPVSMYSDATLTTQFLLEDHAVRHAYHHLAKIKATVNR